MYDQYRRKLRDTIAEGILHFTDEKYKVFRDTLEEFLNREEALTNKVIELEKKLYPLYFVNKNSHVECQEDCMFCKSEIEELAGTVEDFGLEKLNRPSLQGPSEIIKIGESE